MTCLFALQQLHATPTPTQVGAEIVVTATSEGGAVAGLAVEVEVPSGARQSAGVTDAAGAVRFTPEALGMYAFAATIDGVRCVAPIAVGRARRGWLFALASVPLGFALLFVLIRRASSRGAAAD